MVYERRIKNAQRFLKHVQCDALLVDDSINLYYLTGMELSQGKLLITGQESFLIVDNRYFELCQKKCALSVLLATPHTLSDLLINQEDLNQSSAIKTLAFSSEMSSYKNYLELQAIVDELLKKSELTGKKRKLTLKPLDNPIKELRTIKDGDEVELLRQAAHLGSQGFDFVCTQLKEGISEEEVAAELEIFWKKQGSKGLAFAPIIAFGENGSMPHYRAGSARLKKGDAVLIDIGVNLKHYHSDMTRMVFFGKPDPRILEIYEVVKAAQEAALELCRPGVLIGALDKAARDLIAEKGYADKFTHSLGHGVGLEIHELPVLRNSGAYANTPLQTGMVITIEPGIYLSGIGGVRLEDTVVIAPEGYENITKRSLEIKLI